MKKAIFLILFFAANIAQSQIIDTCIMRYKYKFTYQPDSTNSDLKGTDIMILQIGSKTSLYYSEAARKGDSMMKIDEAKGFDIQQIQANSYKYNFGKSRTVIAKNYPANQMTVADQAIKDYKYTEPLEGQHWKIMKDTATLFGLKCQKATTTFRGRNYQAWFTRQIHVANGPWKFYGLPGLIVKIADSKNQFAFEFIGIELPQANEPMEIIAKEYIKATRKEVWDLKKLMADDPVTFMENVLEMKIIGKQLTPAERRSRRRPFNPMELEPVIKIKTSN